MRLFEGNSMSDDGKYSAQHTVTFSETVWYERLWRIVSYLPDQVPLFTAVTISFWGVAEVLAEIDGETLSLRNLATPALGTALAVAIYRAAQKYANYVPEALASECTAAKKVYRRGRSGWQFALAKEMLVDRITSFDRTLERIESGSQFISPKHIPGPEYLEWLQRKPEILLRLIRATAIQCTSELPSVLATTKKDADLSNLKNSVEQLAHLYEEATKFELEVRGVMPPEELEGIHQMTFGWSAPVRNGITNFVDVLDAISKIDAKRVAAGTAPMPDFGIKFLPPHNIDKFTEAIKSVYLQ